MNRTRATAGALLGLIAFALLAYELVLPRVFALSLLAHQAHLALAVAMLGTGTGALAQHLFPRLVPADRLIDRVGLFAVLQGITSILAVAAALWFPVLQLVGPEPEFLPEAAQWTVSPLWAALLVPVLALPAALAGAATAGVFRAHQSGMAGLYAADLLGAAVGAALPVPLMAVLPAPDVVFVAAAGAAIGGLVAGGRPRLLGAGLAVLCAVALARAPVLPVRANPIWGEHRVTEVRWTALCRVAVRDGGPRGFQVILDNASISPVVRTEVERDALAAAPARSAAWTVHPEARRVAVLAASAGPEVAVALGFGAKQIDAVDIVGEIATLVRDAFPDAPLNPYRSPAVRAIAADGRAALRGGEASYDLIQVVNANLNSASGRLFDAWSPSRLYTRQALSLYLEHLAPGGLVSLATEDKVAVAWTALAALEARGVRDPQRHVAVVGGHDGVVLVKESPFTASERDRLRRSVTGTLLWDPAQPRSRHGGTVLTDDKPWSETWAMVPGLLGSDRPEGTLVRTLAAEAAVVLVAGAFLLGVPLLVRRREVEGAGRLVGTVACLGVGYLIAEMVIIHQLTDLLGHPVLGIATAVVAMLVASAAGSALAGRVGSGRGALAVAIGLGVAQVLAVPALLDLVAGGLPTAARVAVAALAVAPLAVALGMPLPLVLRDAPERAVPWAWSVNAWGSVAGAFLAFTVARFSGYGLAMGVAVLAWAIAAALYPRPGGSPARGGA